MDSETCRKGNCSAKERSHPRSAFHLAPQLNGRLDAALRAIVLLSLEAGLTASACVFIIGEPLERQ
jgi:hypothetical protein